YGKHNGEVYAEVAAARLFWALGFGAERMYPVRVVCQACPPSILHDTDVASVQRKMPGTDLETADLTGWAWPDLDLPHPAGGWAARSMRVVGRGVRWERGQAGWLRSPGSDISQ